jgi:hypothetical protein
VFIQSARQEQFSFNEISISNFCRPPMASQLISSQYSTTGTSDSIASSYRPPEQKQQTRPSVAQSSSRSSSAKYPYQSQQQQQQQQSDSNSLQVSDELIHHPTIIKLQQQNFHRLLSSAGSTTSSSSAPKQQQPTEPDPRTTYFNTTNNPKQSINSLGRSNEEYNQVKPMSDTQRAALHQRKQALMKAIQSINEQMEELDMQ